MNLCFLVLLTGLSSFPYGTISIAPKTYFYLLYFKCGKCFVLNVYLVIWVGGWARSGSKWSR